MKKRVKMVDVARAAEVSRTTVSLVLNQVPGIRIAEATRQRVLQVARDLGYSPGPTIEQINQGRGRLFGVLINEVSAAYPVDLLYELQNWADAQADQLLVQITNGMASHEAAALDTLARIGVRDVVYANTFTAIVSPHPAIERFRHVLLNCRREHGGGLAVLPAERRGGFLAAEHLLACGKTRIATITGDPWQVATTERLAGYHRALNKAGRNLGQVYERNTDWSHAQGYLAARELLELAAPPDAIFCHNDLIARGALAAARDLALDVPGDVAIVGYDDREFSKDLGLTSVTLPFAEMAERALGELSSPGDMADKVITISGSLVLRNSSSGRP